ncbi:MAG: hypothetical protein ACJARN_000963 [Arenicella sp.]|jgi:hypothetical protein
MEQGNSGAQSVEFMLATIASRFNGCCRIFAPRYREAHILSFMVEESATEKPENAFKAIDLAFTDVAKASEQYLQHENQGRPFMLVGHSQSTLHGLRLLGSHIDGKALQSKLVASYLLGFWLPEQRIEKDFRSITTCLSEQQTDCIVAYDSYAQDGHKIGKLPIWEKDKLGLNEREKSVCINPLTWTNTLDKISKENHLGSLPIKIFTLDYRSTFGA